MEPIEPNLSTSEAAEILDRVLAGEGSPEEVQWAAEYWHYTDLGTAVGHAGHYAADPSEDLSLERTAQLWGVMLRHIQQSYGAISPSAPQRTGVQRLGNQLLPLRRRSLPQRALIVTAIGVVAGIVLGGLMQMARTMRPGSAHNIVSRTYATQQAQRATIMLEDGSTVVLAPETQLRYTCDATGTRSIDLVGEAFFTVSQHSNRPFVVHTGAVSTRVLGTTFDVRRYSRDPATQVTVISGRVSSGGITAPVVLTAGNVGHITDSIATISTISDPLHAVSWTQGRLEFTDTPVPVMLATLGRWYGFEFRLADTALATQYVSIDFKTGQVQETMNILKTLLGVTMTFDGRIVTLHPQHTQHSPTHRTLNREFLDNPQPEVGK